MSRLSPASAGRRSRHASPMTWFTVPSYRRTAAIMCSSTGSRSFRASSGSRSASSSIEPFKSGEQHGDLLALAFERTPRGQDPLGEMLRRVGLRRASLDLWANRSVHRTPGRTSPILANRLGTSSRSMPGAYRTPGKTWLVQGSRAGTAVECSPKFCSPGGA